MRAQALGNRAISQMTDAIKKTRRMRPSHASARRHRGTNGERRRIQLTEDLSAPDEIDQTPTTAEARILEVDPTTGKLTDSGRTLTVTCFDHTLTDAVSGMYGKVERMDGVWELYWLGCEASEAFGA